MILYRLYINCVPVRVCFIDNNNNKMKRQRSWRRKAKDNNFASIYVTLFTRHNIIKIYIQIQNNKREGFYIVREYLPPPPTPHTRRHTHRVINLALHAGGIFHIPFRSLFLFLLPYWAPVYIPAHSHNLFTYYIHIYTLYYILAIYYNTN